MFRLVGFQVRPWTYSMKTPIKKIVLDLGGKEIALTLEQAKTLFGALNEMFGSKTTFSPIYIERPDRWYWQRPFYEPYTITWTAGDTGLMSNTVSCATAQIDTSGTLRLTC